MRNVGDRPTEYKNIDEMTLEELEDEVERLENFSDSGEITYKQGQRLVKARRLLRALDSL